MNNENDIKTSFEKAYREKETLTVVEKYKKNEISLNYMVYSFSALSLLKEKIKKQSSSQNSEHIQVRFVVEENGNCWFASEGLYGEYFEYDGQPTGIREHIPAHSDMRPGAQCLAAGIIVFSKNDEISHITNFSGHYHPTPGTLVWIIAALIKFEAKFSPEVVLGFYWNNVGKTEKYRPSIKNEHLIDLLPEGCTINPNNTYTIHTYSSGVCQTFDETTEPYFAPVSPSRKYKNSIIPSNNNMDFSIFWASPFPTETASPPSSMNSRSFFESPFSLFPPSSEKEEYIKKNPLILADTDASRTPPSVKRARR
jgi:hypothetical protein